MSYRHCQLKPCPHCLTKVRLSQKTATVAEFGGSHTFLGQCGQAIRKRLSYVADEAY